MTVAFFSFHFGFYSILMLFHFGHGYVLSICSIANIPPIASARS